MDADESPRKDTTLEALAKLKPAFQKDGSVTAGNAPGLNDGASALVVTSLAFAKAHGLAPLARITAYATGGGEPKELFFAPILAVQNLMKKAGTTIGDYDLIEANEAFAVQALADGRAPRLGLGARQRERRRRGPRPPDRCQRRPGAHDAALRHEGPRRRDRPRDPLPRRRQRRGTLRGGDVTSPDRLPGPAARFPAPVHRRGALVAIALGAALVALAAQVRFRCRSRPVPVTLQGLAVLLVGGLFGPAAGAAALVIYLALGIAGLPGLRRRRRALPGSSGRPAATCSPFPSPPSWRRLAPRGGFARALLAALLGMLVIHPAAWRSSRS